ncbi:type VI secretion system lipoprotein TssJ [Paraburkholderia fungorum]|uniref:type VI secretion system lipoprotein TssJ n=1 Tax=Paraburkholderia fungorum TaxID=134537 RepID=UPI000DB60D2B|nr:type VI secretion system lipoprotein TssJ [Paraburkholderia fungorum]PZR50223.1 MAG: type VI secretion system lipoprotein TssJ [Paraburkholderia fungorum]
MKTRSPLDLCHRSLAIPCESVPAARPRAAGHMRRLLVLGAAGSLLAGCGMMDKLPLIGKAKPPPPPPVPATPQPQLIDVTLKASVELNPDITGRPSPLAVRLYQLKSASKFANADFFALFDHDSALLGADLLAREDLQIEPGTSRTAVLERAKELRQVAVLAAYRDVDSASWRAVIDVWPAEVKRVEVRLEALGVAIAPGAAPAVAASQGGAPHS